MIVLKKVLKFKEMVMKSGNDFETSEFYPSRTSAKVENDESFFQIFKISGK